MFRLTLLLFLMIGFSASAQKRPNIVFILADDLGYHDLGYTGSSYYETPNIDALAAKSMNFVNGYAASRVCSPSRAAIMTGKSPARVHITDWIGAKTGEDWRSVGRANKLMPAEYLHALPEEEITMAEAFKNDGYTTFFAGKWHLGGKGSWPEDHGFEINKGGFHAGSPMGGYFSPFDNPNLENEEDGQNLSLRLARETSQFIAAHKDKPFFAFLSFYAVHGPIQTTEERWRKYQQKLPEGHSEKEGFEMERVLPIRKYQDNPVYAGLVETMDEAIGNVMQTLQDQGLAENTIIVFTSDNGGVASGDAFSTSNAPLRGGKGYQWEGGIKEPYLISVPGLTDSGLRNETPVVGMDFYPTLLDLVGIKPFKDQYVDGVSLKPLFEGKELQPRKMYWHYPHYGNQGGEPSSIIRDGNWKFIHYWEDGRNELYHLQNDPSEQSNLIESEVKIAEQMKRDLKAWLTDTKAALPQKDPQYSAAAEQKVLEKYRDELWPRLEKQRKEMLSDNFSPNDNWWGSKLTRD
ncbi:sulfatase [Jiulongibacter sediminis]|uniref:Sulfatase n=1 Tax=Jiulongibacter sediminis TaxID=1605367 RepID=A0A0P7BV84_9BACT|nr:sulfatase [Jiulongibacter sediminis]KPM48803.1 sulfatase [Jiulongibacter sediminis]TBX25335.1 sulfatase [Jiulongibacter sediminis]